MKKIIRSVAAMATAAACLPTSSLHAQEAKAAVHHMSGRGADAGIPRPGMTPVRGHVAVVITDPQSGILSTNGVAWGVVGQNVTENNAAENLESLLKAARNSGTPVFISPHDYHRHDHQWKFEGALTTEGFNGSGADWPDRHKPNINDGKTAVTSPPKVFGPESNDLAPQLRKAGISQVILADMSANLCLGSHMRELIERGFHVVVVPDAAGAAKLPGHGGFEAAFVNYRMIASDIWSTAETVKRLDARKQPATTLPKISAEITP